MASLNLSTEGRADIARAGSKAEAKRSVIGHSCFCIKTALFQSVYNYVIS